MNCQCDHHRQPDFRKPVSRGLVKMTRSTGGTDVKNIPADDREKEVTRTSAKHELPPTESPEYLRPDAAYGHAKQGARAQTDKGAKLFVGARQQGTETPSGKGNRKGGDDPQ
jgi:hypothetical protein